MAVEVLEALDKINNLSVRKMFEIIPMEEALDRISAVDIYATSSLPKFNNSAMDGYAILYNDRCKKLKVVDKFFAGDQNNTKILSETCARVMTGAKLPLNCDAVVPQEEVTVEDGYIKINAKVLNKQHIREIGEDIKNGELLIKKGDKINYAKITLLACQGFSHIKVFRKPKVVVFSSGDELKLHYEKIEDYQIYNSNTPTFLARAKELGCDVEFIGQANDSVESIVEHVKNSMDADLIVTSGGVSVGEADFTKEAFDTLGLKTIIDGINIKPGKPTVFGKINDTYILNLPGNPLASALIFEFIGKIIIQKLLGSNETFHCFIEIKLAEKIVNKKGRTTLMPGYFDGKKFFPSSKRSPGMVSTLSNCNCIIALHKYTSHIEENAIVKVLPINWNFLTDHKRDFFTYE